MDQTYEELEPRLWEILDSGGTFWGKFTCENCGSRQTFEEKNKLSPQVFVRNVATKRSWIDGVLYVC